MKSVRCNKKVQDGGEGIAGLVQHADKLQRVQNVGALHAAPVNSLSPAPLFQHLSNRVDWVSPG
ncbi:Uncharacterised protein [Serratia fonticola]|nr:Uncharacterised protein [Serratia fonticola]